jgi:hypothetical protein
VAAAALAAFVTSSALAVTVVPGVAVAGEPAMKPEARAHLERGLAAYGDKDWTTAIREFREGYAIDPRPDFLFAWAQASRLSGDCARAIELYDQFVATGPAPEQRDAATKMSERCRESVAAEKPAEPPAPAAPAAPAAPTTPPPAAASDAASERAWWKDGWGAGFTAAGLVGLGVGVGFYVAAGSSDDAATHADSYDAFERLKDEAASRRTFAAIGLAAGGALLVTGAVRYVLVHHAARHASADVAVSFAPGVASIGLRGSF